MTTVAPEIRAFHGVVMREVMSSLSGLIGRHDLTPAQISALFRVRAAGSLTVSQVGGQLGLTSGTSSHLVDRLVRRDLLVRTEADPDRRHRHVRLTPTGGAFLAEFDTSLEEALARLLAAVPAADVQALAHALRAVLPHLE